jgi:hypothetical protein
VSKKILFDEKCYELAVYFLAGKPSDTEENRKFLATDIQDAVENWMMAWDDTEGVA